MVWCCLCCRKEKGDELPSIRATAKPWQVYLFTLFWGGSVFLVACILSGVPFADSARIVYSPTYSVTHNYVSADKEAKYEWDGHNYGCAIIYYMGFFFTPIIKVMALAAAFSVKVSSAERYRMIRIGRAAARLCCGPLLIATPDFMMGVTNINKLIFSLTMQPAPALGFILQWILFPVLVIAFEILWLLHHNGKEPTPPRSIFRACCYGISFGCFIACCFTPMMEANGKGFIPEYLQDPVDIHKEIWFPKTYFQKLPYIPSLPRFSVHFWLWLFFGFGIPALASLFAIFNQIFVHPVLENVSARLSSFWVFDVFVWTALMHQLFEKQSIEYQETHGAAFICDHVHRMKCLDVKSTYLAGFYWMIAHCVFFYLDDIRILGYLIYRKCCARGNEYELQVNDDNGTVSVTSSAQPALLTV